VVRSQKSGGDREFQSSSSTAKIKKKQNFKKGENSEALEIGGDMQAVRGLLLRAADGRENDEFQ